MTLTGDMHENWAGELKLAFDDPNSATVGHEFVATSISSDGDGNDQRSYLLCDVTPEHWATRYRVVD